VRYFEGVAHTGLWHAAAYLPDMGLSGLIGKLDHECKPAPLYWSLSAMASAFG
jgi:hypothetical protein